MTKKTKTMKYYIILFYKKKSDQMHSAKYYREFPSWEEMVEWAKEIERECGYYRSKPRAISYDKYIKGIESELNSHA